MLRAQTDGSLVRLGDVARVELGAENYATISRFNGQPATGMAISARHRRQCARHRGAGQGAAGGVREFFPAGLKDVIPYDTTPFVTISIEEVVKTLFEAIVLVFLVMYLFLQNLRATLIPTHRGAGGAARHLRRARARSASRSTR